MRVKRLVLEDYRAFGKLEMEFLGNLTVLVGVNGAGKSSVLDAISVLLSRLVDGIRTNSKRSLGFKELDIKNGRSVTSGTIEIDLNGEDVGWSISKTRRGRNKTQDTDIRPLKAALEKIRHTLEEDADAGVPVAVFYGVNRAVVDIPLRIRKKHTFDRLAAYDGSSLGGTSDFRLFFEWFRNREDLENEIRLDSSHEYQDHQLRAVRTAIENLTGFGGLRIRRAPLRMEVHKEGQKLNVAQLSDGEKCLFALTGDLARRLAMANPGMEKPLEGEAVVMIDEVDLHLHPEWQHMVLPSLLKTFPKCQFIVSTHSPQVLSNVQSENIYLLVRRGSEVEIMKPDGTYGHDSNYLLKVLFGSQDRPKIIARDIDKLFELVSSDIKSARELLDDLKNRVEGAVPDLVRAEALLHRLETMQN